MPEKWWSVFWRKSNGYFGCETTHQEGNVIGFNTWAYFETKQIQSNSNYEWITLNIFTRWIPSLNQTFLLIFDLAKVHWEPMLQSISKPVKSYLGIPFWPYSHVLEILVSIEESAVWAIRDQVRAFEKNINPGRLQPEYRRMHDIARHAIHVSESLDVSVQNIETIIKQYGLYIESQPRNSYSGEDEDLKNKIEFFRCYIASLRHRSISNEKRLQNEIQLAFNIVAQDSAETSMQIGRAAQVDSSTMKTIAFVTLAFLPPTFISSIFSMSFFQSGNNGWGMSDKFWIYWVFAIPTTIATLVVWQYWHKLFPKPTVAPVISNVSQEHV
ncbi:hypothetical protein N7495_009965 [Penicillium taxi]|uniref:uncharacterized protein n=1 Tax=Penicillium taxi TaxID=168475 RepID=UPI0025452C7D|nr:uncharacterized protein N7495_009965 [Penicillium taxi]KAJ5885455.1 hypothetical protein N7495_009965 [Penicillium taxi]